MPGYSSIYLRKLTNNFRYQFPHLILKLMVCYGVTLFTKLKKGGDLLRQYFSCNLLKHELAVCLMPIRQYIKAFAKIALMTHITYFSLETTPTSFS